MSADGMSMSCQELVELVTAYFEDALPAADRARFDAHLRICDPCVVYLRQIEDTIRAVGATGPELAETPPVAALLELFSDWKRRSPEIA